MKNGNRRKKGKNDRSKSLLPSHSVDPVREKQKQPLPVIINDTIKISPISEKKWSISDKINVFMAVLSLISVLVAAWTVHEMKIDRDAAYSPNILINPIDVTFSWDKDGIESWVNTDGDNSNFTITQNEDGSYSGTIKIQLLTSGAFYSLPMANIGVGSAKNITFMWDSGNAKRLIDTLLEYDPSKSDFCEIGENSATFLYGDSYIVQVNNEQLCNLMYMLPATETDEDYSLPFPELYTILIQEIIKTALFRDSYSNNGPHLFLTVSYDDIIGESYEEIIMIQLKRIYYSEAEDGAGSASYQLIPAYAINR